MKSATVEIMPDIKDGAEHDKANKKKTKKYILRALKSQTKDTKSGPIRKAPANEETEIQEVAPPGKKYERMVKHIKKNYPKDKEGIAYATAWKHKNKNK